MLRLKINEVYFVRGSIIYLCTRFQHLHYASGHSGHKCCLFFSIAHKDLKKNQSFQCLSSPPCISAFWCLCTSPQSPSPPTNIPPPTHTYTHTMHMHISPPTPPQPSFSLRMRPLPHPHCHVNYPFALFCRSHHPSKHLQAFHLTQCISTCN